MLSSELIIQQEKSSRISAVVVQPSKQKEAGNCLVTEMKNQVLVHFSEF